MKHEQKIMIAQIRTKQKELRGLFNIKERNIPTIEAKVKEIKELSLKLEQLRHPSVVPDIPSRDPALRELEQKLSGKSKLTCPECGASDNGNTNNGKPWCFRCQVALVSAATPGNMAAKMVKRLTKLGGYTTEEEVKDYLEKQTQVMLKSSRVST